jgi:hypothetical protein
MIRDRLQRCAGIRGRGDEAGPQAVASEDFWIETGGFRPRLDDERDLVAREASG